MSLDDWDMLTWSLGCTGVLLPSTPPSISIARFEMTCQMRSIHSAMCGASQETYLIDVHVGLGARAGLEHDEGEVILANLARDDLARGCQHDASTVRIR